MNQFTNRSACRKFLLERAEQKWPGGKFTRVSQDVFDFLEASIRTDMETFVRAHPTKGKTLTTGLKRGGESEIKVVSS
jgi:hypothetical protein